MLRQLYQGICTIVLHSYSNSTSMGHSRYCLQQHLLVFGDHCLFCSSVAVGWFSQCIFLTLPPLDQRHFNHVSFINFLSTLRQGHCILTIEMLFQYLSPQISVFQCSKASQQQEIVSEKKFCAVALVFYLVDMNKDCEQFLAIF